MLSRQKIKYILLTSLIFISFLLVIFEWICRTSPDCKCNPYSLSKENTIEDGTFINSYYSITKSIQISGTQDITFDSAWTEYAKSKKTFLGICIFENTVVVKDFTSNTFSLPITISKDAKPFTVSFESLPATVDRDVYVHQENNNYKTMHLRLSENPDTVKVIVANLDTTVKNRIDTILFVKRK